MHTNIVTRWEEWRDLTGGSKRHRDAVADWLGSHPALLYWGDSWFSTPLYPNLARQSAQRIDGLRMIVGKPGATAAELLAPRAIRQMAARIAANPFDVMCLSIGGNDALSERLAAVFKPWMRSRRKKITAQEAFAILLQDGLLGRLRDRYQRLFDVLRREVLAHRPGFRVVGHSYAPLCRIGDAGDLRIANIGLLAILKDDVGPWLWDPMKRVLDDLADGKQFADLLLVNGFRDLVLEPLRAAHPDFFSYADFGTVDGLADPALWYDEIHPTEQGFQLCVPVLNTALREVLPEPKRMAVGV